MQRNRILLRVKNVLDQMNRWVADNWVAFNLFIILWDVFLIPTLIYLKSIISIIALFISMFFKVFDDVKFKVGEDDPRTYLKVETLRSLILRSFWVLLLVLTGIIASYVIRDVLSIEHSILYMFENAFSWISALLLGTWYYSSTFLGFNIYKSNALLKIEVRARFRMVLNALSSKNQKDIAKSVSLFREGIQISNNFLRRRFDFVIKDPNRFSNYVKLMTLTTDEGIKQEIRKGIEKVTNEIGKKEIDPFEIVRGLKEIISEPISNKKDVIAEVEIEPRFRKWFLANLQIIIMILETLSLAVVVLSLLLGR